MLTSELSDISAVLARHKKVVLKDFSGGSFAQFLVKLQHQTHKPVIVIAEDQKRLEVLKDEIEFFSATNDIPTLPPFDVLPYYGLSPHRGQVLHHLGILHRLISQQTEFLVVHKNALLRRCLDREMLEDLTISLTMGDLVDRNDLIRKLSLMGYERSSLVEEPGQFAVRGDIIDVFTPPLDSPLRISFFDIEIETIKFFDPASQRTARTLHQATIIPVHEILLNLLAANENTATLNANWKIALKKRADRQNLPKQKRDQIEEFVANRIYFHGIEFFLPLFCQKTGTLFDYFPHNSFFVCDTDEPLEAFAGLHLQELSQHRGKSEHIETIFEPDEIYLKPEEIVSFLKDRTCLFKNLSQTDPGTAVIAGNVQSNQFLQAKISSQIAKIHSLAPLASELNQHRLQGIACAIVCRNDIQVERVQDLLRRFNLPLRVVSNETKKDVLTQWLKGGDPDRLVTLMEGTLHEGFLSHETRQWWLTDEEIFGKKVKRSARTAPKTGVFSSFVDLSTGDFLIHLDHGVGIYKGLSKLAYDVNKNDFLSIEYLGGDKLYVPIDKLNRVQRFVAQEDARPQIDKLGGKTWLKTRTKARRAARKLARELLDIQARREQLTGYAFGKNQDMMEEFEAGFEFEETPDQQQTITEVLQNMESPLPMDRLVCGDVGYGKTEVALRAAFKAVCDHKQVFVLVPTTVLAFQHHATFSERLKNYAVNVELLSRFRTQNEQKKIVQKIKSGEADIVVGTHRLLSRDVKPRDLGLLIIDEEHRFGVAQKEQIKKLKNLVDVITLTATPIPRTLNFALNGIRDLSLINTPPADRLAVKTYACYFDTATIRDTLLKELRRGGQAFFVHNRVQSIQKIAKQVAELVPEARVRFAHGQMPEDGLEEVMIAFMKHEFDVLVCTAIIESGLDIPNANTMLINHADTFGLAQLYQLRGRVGRSFHQAYCYLIVPQEGLMTAKAKKRLAAIQKFTELGSGFKVASRDLEIRGAGNILGAEQSGHIAAVGYDMYVHLLQEAIGEIKNQHIPEEFEPEIQLNIAAKIPDDLIPDESLRLILYKQISSCRTGDEVEAVVEEWQDRFGKLPPEVKQLAGLIKIKILCKDTLVSNIRHSNGACLLNFHPDHRVDTRVLLKAVQDNPKKFSITRDGRFVVHQKFESPAETLAYLTDLLSKLKQTVMD